MRVFVWLHYLFASCSYRRLLHTSELLHGFRLEMLLGIFIISNLANFVKTLRTGDADLRFYITTVQDG